MTSQPTSTPSPGPNRRAVVVGGTVALGAAGLALAGCGGSDSGSGSAAPTAAATAGTVLGPTSDVPVGGAKFYETANVVVTQATAGTYAGFSAVCPHQQCAVSQVEGSSLVCPCHKSMFALDGSVTQGPARTGLTSAAVTVTGTDITLA